MHILVNSRRWLKNEIRGVFLLRGVLVLLPFAALFLITKNHYWLQISILAIATLIPEEKLKLTFLGVLLHGFCVILLFYLLLLTQHQPMVFVLLCAFSATGIIWVATQGEQLRTLGSWTFIPAIILSIEMASTFKNNMFYASLHFFPYLISALLPTLCIASYEHFKIKKQDGSAGVRRWSYFTDFGKKESNLESMAAMALGITLSACLVEYLPMENGQWMIWGVASVITGNIETSPKKFRERLTGVSIGVPLGIICGQYIPATSLNLTLVTVALFLTLVAFRRYIIAYTFRCFFVATAAMLITHSRSIAFERLTHVIFGGLIGVGCVLVCRFFAKTAFSKP